MAIDTSALFDLNYGLYIVTAESETEISGCIVNTAMQLTAEPITVMVAVNKDNFTNHVIAESGKFTIVTLSDQADIDLVANFGFHSTKDYDKFAEYPALSSSVGTPYVVNDMASSGLVCEVIDSVDVYTHTVFVGKLIAARKFSDADPMTYSYYHKVLKGTTPKNASAYVPPQAEVDDSIEAGDTLEEPTELLERKSAAGADADAAEPEKQLNKYQCLMCGYVVEVEGELPDDYVCPLCGAPKSAFKLIS